MAEKKQEIEQLKRLEIESKKAITGFLDNLVKKDVIRLPEDEKKKFNNAAPRDKAWIFEDFIRQKPLEAVPSVFQSLLKADKKAKDTEEEKQEIEQLRKLETESKRAITGFLDNLVKKDVIRLPEDEKKKFNNAAPRDKAWIVADFIRQKPLEAVPSVFQSLLKADKKAKDTEGTKAGTVEPAESTNTLKLCSPEQFQRLHNENTKKIYPIKEKNNRTRQALIICNIEFEYITVRSGAECDITEMKGLLESLDYTVKVKKNLKAEDMKLELMKFADLPEHKSSDSMFLVLMSHGTLHGICGTLHSKENEDVLPYDSIFQIFNNCNCVALKDKPKVIIVQACRGGNRGETWIGDSPAVEDSSLYSQMNLDEDAVYKTHVEKDFIAFYSSTPHNISWRYKTGGSPFIIELIKCFQKYSCCNHLEELFLRVRSSFDEPGVRAQMPTVERVTLTKHFYLFPGYCKSCIGVTK
ncbi:caspase-13-like isoform 2-T2 [Callospermophilus lateralis]|uniref:caspase-13-like isoform X2 n=2 Tax=Callospermophilus lateralis TaxID=76772 RepID=UPI004053F8F9